MNLEEKVFPPKPKDMYTSLAEALNPVNEIKELFEIFKTKIQTFVDAVNGGFPRKKGEIKVHFFPFHAIELSFLEHFWIVNFNLRSINCADSFDEIGRNYRLSVHDLFWILQNWEKIERKFLKAAKKQSERIRLTNKTNQLHSRFLLRRLKEKKGV